MIEIKPMNNTDKYNNSCRCPLCDAQFMTKDILKVSIENETPYLTVKCECGALLNVIVSLYKFLPCA